MERLAQKRPFETRDGVTKPAIAFGTNRAAVDDDDLTGRTVRRVATRASATSYTVEGIAPPPPSSMNAASSAPGRVIRGWCIASPRA